MNFKLGEKVVTNPELTKIWEVKALTDIHVNRTILTVTSTDGNIYTCKADEGICWLYHKDDLIPYRTMFEEVEEL